MLGSICLAALRSRVSREQVRLRGVLGFAVAGGELPQTWSDPSSHAVFARAQKQSKNVTGVAFESVDSATVCRTSSAVIATIVVRA